MNYQYDYKKRLSADKLYRLKFLRKCYDQLNKIDLSQIKGKVKGGKIRITKFNQYIWDVFGDGTCSSILEDYSSEDFIEPAEETNTKNNEKPDNETNESKKIKSL